jgi:hypothetical protein
MTFSSSMKLFDEFLSPLLPCLIITGTGSQTAIQGGCRCLLHQVGLARIS